MAYGQFIDAWNNIISHENSVINILACSQTSLFIISKSSIRGMQLLCLNWLLIINGHLYSSGASLGVDQRIVTKKDMWLKEIGLRHHKHMIDPYLIASIVGRAYVTKLWLPDHHLWKFISIRWAPNFSMT